MAKKTKQLANSTAGNVQRRQAITFPNISSKEDLECRVLLENQILLIDNFLSVAECKTFVKFIDDLPMELTPPKKRGEADRVNYRFSITSTEFAQTLHSVLDPHLPSFPPRSPSKQESAEGTSRKPHSLNSNIRCYKYTPQQYFGAHYDDSVTDPMTGAKSEWTLLIYVTGVEDGVEGGETLFYKSERCRPEETVTAPLTRGTALLHRHGQECLFHEGSRVIKVPEYRIQAFQDVELESTVLSSSMLYSKLTTTAFELRQYDFGYIGRSWKGAGLKFNNRTTDIDDIQYI